MAPATFCQKLGQKSDTFSKNDPVYWTHNWYLWVILGLAIGITTLTTELSNLLSKFANVEQLILRQRRSPDTYTYVQCYMVHYSPDAHSRNTCKIKNAKCKSNAKVHTTFCWCYHCVQDILGFIDFYQSKKHFFFFFLDKDRVDKIDKSRL